MEEFFRRSSDVLIGLITGVLPLTADHKGFVYS
jgi:hypothetical protein